MNGSPLLLQTGKEEKNGDQGGIRIRGNRFTSGPGGQDQRS